MKKYESYLESPFVVEGIVEKAYTTKEDTSLWQDLVDEQQLYEVKKVSKNKVVLHDPIQYAKLYVGSFDVLMNLTGSSMKVLVYAMCTIRPLYQVCFLHAPDIMLRCGFKSESTVRNAIVELLEAGIIAQKLGSSIEFWVNPNVFFNGNRIKIK